MAAPTIAELKSRRDAAKQERDLMQPLIDEAFDYAIPYRRSTKDGSAGEKRVDKAFDQTAVVAAFRFAGKLQQDLVPTGEPWFKLELGPIGEQLTKADGSEADLRQQLENISKIVGGLFDDGEWDQAFIEMALDMTAGTGAMLILEGDDEHPVRYVNVPIDEIVLEGGPYNDISGKFWCTKWSVRQIAETWPEAKLGQTLEDMLKNKPEEKVDLRQDVTYDRKDKVWRFTAWTDKSEAPLVQSEMKTCPMITPRYFRVPGETMGRGPTMLAMPTIKTTNTAVRLQLQAAAIAMMGIYTAVDDGVFNPDLASVEPGVFWKVQRNGGPLGPSVSKFPEPRLDLSQLVLNDLRMGIQAAMMDQSLPADGAAVRSATEILERVKRLASDHQGAFGRLVREIIIPAVRRVMEIAWRRGLIQDAPPIDQLLVRVRVTSPIAAAREAARIQRIIQWLEMVLMLLQGNAGRVAQVEQILIAVGRVFGVDEAWITTDAQRQAMDRQAAAAAAASDISHVAAGKPIPTPGG